MNDDQLSLETIMATMVHDIKNSLGLINSQLDGVIHKLSKTSGEEVNSLVRVRLETSRINNDLMHMLGFYRLRTELLSPVIEDVFLEDLFTDVISRFDMTLSELNIDFSLSIAPEADCWFLDPVLTEGMLNNVLTNSIRYTHSKLSVKVLVTEDQWLKIQITDDGEGYPESMLNWHDEVSDINFKTGSTGLGLYFNQQIASMHETNGRKGYFELENDSDNGGAIFTLYLP